MVLFYLGNRFARPQPPPPPQQIKRKRTRRYGIVAARADADNNRKWHGCLAVNCRLCAGVVGWLLA